MGIFSKEKSSPLFLEHEEFFKNLSPMVLAFFKEEKIKNLDEAFALFIFKFSLTVDQAKAVVPVNIWALFIAKYVVYLTQVDAGNPSSDKTMKDMIQWVNELNVNNEELPEIFFYFQIAKKDTRPVWEIYLDELKKVFRDIRSGK